MVEPASDTLDDVARGEPAPETLRRIRRAGHYGLLFLLGVFLIVSATTRDDPASPYGYLWGLAMAHLTGGRVLNAAVGREFGFSPWFVFFQASMIDLILMCYLWPLLVEGHRQARHLPLIGSYLESVHHAARRNMERVGVFGDLGLLVFVSFPLWCTGPLVGSFAGFLAGMSTVRVFTVVTVGNTVAVAAWIFAYNRLRDISPVFAFVAFGTVFLLVVGGGVYRYWRNHRHGGAA